MARPAPYTVPTVMDEKWKHYPFSSIYRNVVACQYGTVRPWDLYSLSKSSRNFIQRLKKYKVLEGHSGCVNTVSWNDCGSLLLTGSDDYLLNIYDTASTKLLHSIESGHRTNVFSAKFIPCTSDLKIVSCSGDGMLQYNELGTTYGRNYFNCHSGTTYEVLVTPGDPNTFLSCGEDGTVRLFDLRTKTKCHCQECAEDILIDARHAVTSFTVNPMLPYHLAIGCKDSVVRVFDRRTLGTSANTRSVNRNRGWMTGLFCKFRPSNIKQDTNRRVTSLQYSDDGSDLLVSYCTDYIYLFTVKDSSEKAMDANSSDTTTKNGYHVNGTTHDKESNDSSEDLPPVKRLRLRGDWSDTGPQSRPEADEEVSPENNLMQRMSELFSRWIEDAMAASLRRASTSSEDDSSVEYAPQQYRSATNSEQNVSNEHPNVASEDAIPCTTNEQQRQKPSTDTSSDNLETGTHSPEDTNHGNNETTVESPSRELYLLPTNSAVASDNIQKNSLTTSSEKCAENKKEMAANDPDDDVDETVNGNRTSESVPTAQSQNPYRNQASLNGTGVNSGTSQDEHSTPASSPGVSDDPDNPEFRERVQTAYSSASRYSTERQFAASKIQSFIRLHRSRNKEQESTGGSNKPEHVYLPKHRMVYKGHRNARTMIKEANFWGEDYVLSGSDCGRIFIWDRHTGELVMLLEGDRHVVNCVQPHPFDPILATSGIDHDVKLWTPLLQQPPDLSNMNEIVERNEKMLEESRDTITVPAAFVLRMFASLGSMQRNRRRNQEIVDEEDE